MDDFLVNIENEGPEWLEWCAALYESYAADHEWNNGDTYLTRPECMPVETWRSMGHGDYSIREYGESLASLSAYCRVAEQGCTDLENKIYNDRLDKIEFDDEYDLAWGVWQEQIYDPDR
jgi:hypothetical protein